ncbi:Histidine kinase [Xylanibacter ruminicola]|jgi:two-component sensor histidine kinase|uniref:Histidine kinase n=1 Tax=Xylanibacter ruminicola TaxID=839 RepID=A0A1H5X0G0_XYLRU|nr:MULTISPECIES: sensor histidine kinase [Prevotellaceae]MCR5471346.1 sensor histidine kinase [Prevotella sp.]SEG04767.1 Histidine kinase [Xylanibacter ruminicola]SEW26636.1 Histidine kinase [Prevotella sp. khp7]
MKKIERKDIWLFVAQLAVWLIIMLALPLATFLSTQDFHSTKTSFRVVWGIMHSPFVIYFTNFYILGPFLFFKRRFWLFVLCNLALILFMNFPFIYVFLARDRIPEMPEMSPNMWIGFFSGVFMFLLLNCVIAAIAIGIRHFIRVRQIKQQLQDEKAKNTEAELAWLKSQINPHFLFNTLNNISSLTQINPDAAQDAIAQLSDLLRYAMYETNKKTVPIQGEVEFMRNYIALMELRCNEKTEVTTTFDVGQNMEIAPLLFISLIENAFKHGVSSNRPSKIDINLLQNDDELVFSCDNTNYPKDDADRSGSGIGLENTRRRLDLMYANRYKWEQTLEGEMYHIKIILKI